MCPYGHIGHSHRVPDQPLQPLRDLEVALSALEGELEVSSGVDSHVSPAVRARLVEISALVRCLPEELMKQEPTLPWRDLADLPSFIDDDLLLPTATIQHYRPLLTAAVRRLTASLRAAGCI